MALYAFDGTGNEDREGTERDSNVLNFFNAYQDPLKNSDPKAERGSLYLEGIGLRANTGLGEKIAEAFGIGGHSRLRDARRRVENNLAAGDLDVDIVGFSRGAALAIDFANQVCKKVPKANVRFVGVWDIVAQFGAPGEHVNLGFDLDCPDVVCYHAMAIDEDRAFFPLTRLSKAGKTFSKLREVWFRGVHSDIGGGNANLRAQLDRPQLDVRERAPPQTAHRSGRRHDQPRLQGSGAGGEGARGRGRPAPTLLHGRCRPCHRPVLGRGSPAVPRGSAARDLADRRRRSVDAVPGGCPQRLRQVLDPSRTLWIAVGASYTA